MEKETNNFDTVHKLMILDLVMKGVSQGDIAEILGVSDAKISTLFPKGILKKYRGANK
jgi:transcriptional regulator